MFSSPFISLACWLIVYSVGLYELRLRRCHLNWLVSSFRPSLPCFFLFFEPTGLPKDRWFLYIDRGWMGRTWEFYGKSSVLFFLQSVQYQSINLLLAGKCTIIWLINQFQLLLLLFYFFHVLLDHTSRQLATTWSYILVAVKWSWETLLFVWLKGKKEEGKKIPHPNEW
jgi:hypothetical protein